MDFERGVWVMYVPNYNALQYKYYNTKVKHYPDGTHKIVVCNKDIFRNPATIDNPPPKPGMDEEKESKPQKPGNEVREDSIRRAKSKIFDIAALNDFKYFVTLTFSDEDYVNRYDPKEVGKVVSQWFCNQSKHNNIQYLAIPEHHKDGAIHVHCLCSDSLRVVDSGTVIVPGYNKPIKIETADKRGITEEQRKPVYNVPGWSHGWTTAISCYGERNHIAKYVTKYITKDVKKIFGNFYYAGGGVKREVPYEVCYTRYEDIQAKEFSPVEGMYFKYVEAVS